MRATRRRHWKGGIRTYWLTYPMITSPWDCPYHNRPPRVATSVMVRVGK